MKLVWKTPKPTFSFIPKLRLAVSQHALDLALQVWNGAVDRTPTLSGELRASWNVSKGSPNYKVVGLPRSSPGPSLSPLPRPTAPALVAGSLRSAKYFVTNGKSYAGHVELGSVTVPPHLMLTRAIQAIDF